MLGGWPVVVGDKWDPEGNWTWQQAVLEFRKMGFSIDHIVDFSIGIDFKNSTKRVIDVRHLDFVGFISDAVLFFFYLC